MSTSAGPGIGHNSGIAERRAFILHEITSACSDIRRRREQALSIEEMLNLEGLPRAILLQRHIIEAAINYCRAFPRADAGVAVSAILTLLSDNRDGAATLGVRRLADMLGRSKRHILDCIARHEEIASLAKETVTGKPSTYRPLINRAYADPHMAISWFVDAHSEVAEYGRPKNVVNDAGPLFQKLVNEGTPPSGKVVNEAVKSGERGGRIYTTIDTTDNDKELATKGCVVEFPAPGFLDAEATISEKDADDFHRLANVFGRRPGELVLNPTPRVDTDVLLKRSVQIELAAYPPDVARRACSAAIGAVLAANLTDLQEGRGKGRGGIAGLASYFSKALRTKASDIALADGAAMAKMRVEAVVQERLARRRIDAVDRPSRPNRPNLDDVATMAFGPEGDQ